MKLKLKVKLIFLGVFYYSAEYKCESCIRRQTAVKSGVRYSSQAKPRRRKPTIKIWIILHYANKKSAKTMC